MKGINHQFQNIIQFLETKNQKQFQKKKQSFTLMFEKATFEMLILFKTVLRSSQVQNQSQQSFDQIHDLMKQISRLRESIDDQYCTDDNQQSNNDELSNFMNANQQILVRDRGQFYKFLEQAQAKQNHIDQFIDNINYTKPNNKSKKIKNKLKTQLRNIKQENNSEINDLCNEQCHIETQTEVSIDPRTWVQSIIQQCKLQSKQNRGNFNDATVQFPENQKQQKEQEKQKNCINTIIEKENQKVIINIEKNKKIGSKNMCNKVKVIRNTSKNQNNRQSICKMSNVSQPIHLKQKIYSKIENYESKQKVQSENMKEIRNQKVMQISKDCEIGQTKQNKKGVSNNFSIDQNKSKAEKLSSIIDDQYLRKQRLQRKSNKAVEKAQTSDSKIYSQNRKMQKQIKNIEKQNKLLSVRSNNNNNMVELEKSKIKKEKLNRISKISEGQGQIMKFITVHQQNKSKETNQNVQKQNKYANSKTQLLTNKKPLITVSTDRNTILTSTNKQSNESQFSTKKGSFISTISHTKQRESSNRAYVKDIHKNRIIENDRVNNNYSPAHSPQRKHLVINSRLQEPNQGLPNISQNILQNTRLQFNNKTLIQIKFIEAIHKRECGLNCEHMIRYYEFLRQNKLGHLDRQSINLPKKELKMNQ